MLDVLRRSVINCAFLIMLYCFRNVIWFRHILLRDIELLATTRYLFFLERPASKMFINCRKSSLIKTNNFIESKLWYHRVNGFTLRSSKQVPLVVVWWEEEGGRRILHARGVDACRLDRRGVESLPSKKKSPTWPAYLYYALLFDWKKKKSLVGQSKKKNSCQWKIFQIPPGKSNGSPDTKNKK